MRLAGDAVDPHIHSQVGIVLRADIDLTHYAGADLKAAPDSFPQSAEPPAGAFPVQRAVHPIASPPFQSNSVI